MRKRILSLFLCFVLLISSVPVQVFAAGEYSSDWEFTEGTLVTGDNTVAMVAGAEYTLIEFYPEETGIYTFEGPAGSKLANFNASFFPNNITGEAAADTLEWTCTSVGQSLLLGICAQGDAVTVSVARTGDHVSHEIQYTVYENTHTPDAANKDYCAKASGKLTPADTLVKKGDRYYTESGEAVFVNFTYTNLSISTMLGTSPARYVEKDAAGNVVVAYDYYDALSAYSAMGTYPLTTDLEQMLRHLDIAKRWTEDGWLNGWQELCFLVKDHEAGEAVVEGNVANTYCVACGKLMKSEEAKPKDPHAFGTQKLAVGSNSVALNAGAVYTLNKFTPSETGVYTFEVPAGSKVANYNTSFNPMDLTGDAASTTLEWTCSSVGQHILVGVSGSGESVNVTITRTGDYVSTEIQYTDYENTHTPSKENTDYCANVGGWFSVPSVVPQGDFFYGVTVEGEYIPMFVDFAYSELSLTSMLETSSAKYAKLDENGNVVEAYNYYDALKAYTAFGKYPLTQDLMQMLQHLDEAKGWTENGWLGGWQELCFLAAQHKEGEPVIEGDLAKYYCTGCNKLMRTEEAPVVDDSIASGECGQVSWKLSREGVLTVYGQGAIEMEGNQETGQPWYDYRDQVTAVVLESGVTMIPVHAFAGMQNLKTASLPEGLTSIGSSAFARCDLTTITIPASVTQIGIEVFLHNANLTEILVAEESQSFASQDGVLFNKYMTALHFYPQGRPGASYQIPEGVMAIMASAIRNTNLEELLLPSSLQVIQHVGIGFNFNIKSLTIPAGVKDIQKYALVTNENLETIEFLGDAPAIGENAFRDLTATVSYPAGNATWTQDKLQNYGGNLTWIPYGEPEEEVIAKGTTGDVEWKITLEGQLVFSGEGATGNYNVGDYLTGEFYETPWAEYADQITGIVIESGVTEIGEAVFVGLNRIAEIVIPEGVTRIGADAFANCENLKTVSIPASANLGYFQSFYNCPSLENVWVAEGNPYFYDIDGVVFWIQMASETEEYGRYVYYYPSGRKAATYTIPEDVDLLGVACFRGTQYLEEAILHEGMYWSDGNSFQNSSIKTISIPTTMESFGGRELANCQNLESVYFLGNFPWVQRWDYPGITNATFEGTTTTCYYPAGNETWTEDRLQNYGGTLTWVAYSEECQHPNLKHVEAVAPSCMAEGNMEYWHCQDCGKFWKDEALTQSVENVVLPVAAHDLVHVEAVAASCMAEGNIEHWYCNVCEVVWQDEALTQITNHKNVIIPVADHDLVHVEAVAASCMNEGNIEHWYCKVCEVVWQDEALTQITNHKNVIVPVADHDLVHVEAKEPTCAATGNIEHWYCNVCEVVWQDEALTQVTNHKNVILPENEDAHIWSLGEILEAPTCSTPGKQLCTCDVCGMEDTVAVYGGEHVDEDEDQECDECGEDLSNPLGSQGNPEILELNALREVTVAGDSSYFLQLTVPEEGILTMEVGVYDAWIRATSSGLDPEKYDPADKGYGISNTPCEDVVLWEVAKGETVTIEFYSAGSYDGTGTIRATFEARELPQGANMHPYVVTDQDPSDLDKAQYTVTVPAGRKLYFDTSAVQGSVLNLSAVEGMRYFIGNAEQRADENGIVSIILDWGYGIAIALENTTQADITLQLVFEFEVGHKNNPEPLALGTTDIYLKPYETNGRHFTWTAPADGIYTFHIEGANGYELWQYQMFSDGCGDPVRTAEDDPLVDTTYWEAEAGQRIMIHVIGYAYAPDLVIGTSGSYRLTASFEEKVQEQLPGQTPEDPIIVEFTMNDSWTAGTATVTVEPGIWYYGAYISGMDLTANGEAVEVTPAQPRMPVIFCFTNEGTEAVTYELAVSYPLGTMSNPAALTMGENAAPIEEGNDQGYYFTWTAEVPGALTVTMPQGNWFYTLSNLTAGVYGDMQYSNSDPIVAAPQLEVNAGDQIQLIVNNFDPANPWTIPGGTLTFQASFEEAILAPLALVPMIGEPAQVVKQSDGSYTVYLDKEDVADTVLFSIMAQTLEPISKKDLKWTVSDSRIATVKSDAYSPIGNVTLKAGADGACVITAQNVKTKDVASVTIVIRSYEPRLESASLSLNSNAHAGAVVALTESYGNTISSVTVHEYDTKAKTYAEEESQRLVAEYDAGLLYVTHTQPMKKGTYKLLLKASCANGETYEYPVSLKVTETLPSVTVKQLNKFNTFYTDSEAQFLITAKDAAIAGAELFFGENPAFQGEFDPETGILTVRYSESYLNGDTKLGVKGDIMVFCEGYWIPVEKATTISTEKKAPKVWLDPAASVINTALVSDPSVTIRAFYGDLGNMTSLEDIVKVDAGTFALAEVTEPAENAQIKLTLTGKKGGTAKIYVQAENWAEPVVVSHKITVKTAKPALKFEKKGLTLNNVLTDLGDAMEIFTDQGNVTIESIDIQPVSKKESVLEEMAKIQLDYSEEFVSVRIDPENAPKKGTYEYKVTATVGEDVTITKNFKVTVEDKVPTVKLKASTLKLNKELGEVAYAETPVTVTGGNYAYRLVDLVSEKEYDQFTLHYDDENGILQASLTDVTAKNGKTKVTLYPVLESYSGELVTLSKAVTLTVQIYSGKPSVTLKATGKLDTIVPGSAMAFAITKLTNIAGAPEAVRLEGETAELFNAELTENGAKVTLKPDVIYRKDQTHKLQLVFTICGLEVSANVNLKVTQSGVKLTAPKAVNYYQGQSGRMAVRLVLTAPAGATIGDITLGSQTAKQLLSALGEEAITWTQLPDGTYLVSIRIADPGHLVYGKSYNLFLDVTPQGNAENAKPTSLKVSVKVAK